MENDKFILKVVVGFIMAICAMLLFFTSYYSIAQYERGVLTRFGKVVEVSGPGLHFKIPFVYSIHKYRTDILSLTTPEQLNKGIGVSTYTVDNQEVHVVFTVQYRIRPDKVAFIYENVQDLGARLFQIAEDRLKAEMGKVNTSHVAEKRGEVRDGIKKVLAAATTTLGVEIADFQLNNIEYDPTFKNAVKAAAAARATVETREQERQQAIKVAETVKTVAEGEANAVKEKSQGNRRGDAGQCHSRSKGHSVKGRGHGSGNASAGRGPCAQSCTSRNEEGGNVGRETAAATPEWLTAPPAR